MTGDESDTPYNRTTDAEDGRADERNIPNGSTVARAGNVDAVVDHEPHDSDSEPAGCIGSKEEHLPNTTIAAGRKSSPNGAQRDQPRTTGIGIKEDRPRGGKTTSTFTFNQPKFTETATISRTTRLHRGTRVLEM